VAFRGRPDIGPIAGMLPLVMGFKITEFETTPNPNAVKCWLDRPISEGPRSFLEAGAAADDPIAAALFAEVEVTNLLFNGDWVTINKTPSASWKTVKAAVKRVLAAADAPDTPDAPDASSDAQRAPA
jgi:hypothetical protein